MKVLVVASDKGNRFAPFIEEQLQALQHLGVEMARFGIKGKGVWGYLKAWLSLGAAIRREQPDVIHAHYGLSGLLANLQRKVPVMTTYHGSDINVKKVLRLSKMAMRLSAWNIFVSKQNALKAKAKKKYMILPCGIDLERFEERSKEAARMALGWHKNDKIVVFAGAFDNTVKNAALAKEAVALLKNVLLVELKGYDREEVANVFYAADALLMTSLSEGSPQVIKEAMACGCPIVSVDVGDVKERVVGLDGCFVTGSRESFELAELLTRAVVFEGRTKGRERIDADRLGNRQVAERLVELYNNVLKKRNEIIIGC